MKENKLKIITIILLIILITLVSLFGVYTQKKNKMVNSTQDYKYGMDIDSQVVYKLELEETSSDKTENTETTEATESTEATETTEKTNPEEAKTVDNYYKAKSIIEGRLKDINKPLTSQGESDSTIDTRKIKTEDYRVNVNENNGDIIVTLPKDDNSYYLSSVFTQSGKFEVTDADTKEVLLDKSDIASSKLQYYSYSGYTAVSFRIEFNNQGKDKLKTIKEKYGESATGEATEATTETSNVESPEGTETTTDTTETTSEASTEKKLALKINGEEVYSAKLDEFITNDAIALSIGEATNEKDQIKSELAQGQTLIAVLSNDEMPLTYKLKGSTIVAATEKEDVTGLIYIFAGFMCLIVAVFFVLRYRTKGLLASIAFVGFASLLLLIVRYFNVTMSTEGIVAILLVLGLNTVLLDKIVKTLIRENDNTKVEFKEIINTSIKEMSLKFIPLFIIAVVFTFTNKTPANSFGMVLFWGLTLILLYNLSITKGLLNFRSNKKK